jgi:hypothetical protein
MTQRLAVTLDTETYQNCFLLVARVCDTDLYFTYEISDYRNDSAELHSFLCWLRDSNARAYGFNLLGFDGPLIHLFMRMGGRANARVLYDKAMAIIHSQDDEGDKFSHLVRSADRDFEWVDLYRINHFNNRARSTSLKALEFNMRMDNISDLPFPVGIALNQEQIKILRDYCRHDVDATELFRTKNEEAVKFREHLSAKYGRDMMNHDDVKIGSVVFEVMLEESGVSLYDYDDTGRTPRQTPRPVIALKDAILPWIQFEHPELQRVLNWLKAQTITETKGVFSDVTATINGFELVFGLGGIHGAVDCEVVAADEQTIIESVDVASMYPNIAIVNKLYPEHIGPQFCDVYKKIYELRKTFPKGTPENAAYKLALNGTYGKTNDRFSPFYDPLLTMRITLTGQLLICLLVENLVKVPTVQMKMANTDGIEYTVHPDHAAHAKSVCDWWQALTGLTLEFARYSKLFIRDCNNYVGQFVDGKVKRKGAYEYNIGWHQNASALVVPKVAEKVLVEGAPIRETIENWPDKMDFMLRIKVPRTSHLLWGDEKVQNTSRYYVAKGGRPLTKVMPPLKGKTERRRIGVESGWQVQVCNDIADAVLPVDFQWYINEVEKLCNSLH